MDLQGCRLGLEPFLPHLWSAAGRIGPHDHLSSCQVIRSPKTKCIPKSSANAVVVVVVVVSCVGRVSKEIPGSGSGSGTRWALVTVHRKAASWPSNILPSHRKYVCIRLFDIQKCIKAFSKLKGTDLLPTWLTGYNFSSLRRMAFGCFSMLTCFLCQCTYLKLTESSFPICLELGI